MALPSEIEQVWRLLEHEGTVALFGRSANGVAGGHVRSAAALTRAARNLENANFNVYVGLNPSRPGRIKAAAADIITPRFLLFDVDPAGTTPDPLGAIEAVADALASLLNGLARAASVLLDSGRGAQLWLHVTGDLPPSWRLGRALAAWYAEVERATDMRARFGCELDTSCSDLSRVARCAGTTNRATGRLARFLHADIGAAVPLADILARADGPAPEPVCKPLTNLKELEAHLNEAAARFLYGSWRGRRHHDAYATAARLAELGVGLSEAEAIVVAGGELAWPQLPPADCVAATRNAYAKVRGRYANGNAG